MAKIMFVRGDERNFVSTQERARNDPELRALLEKRGGEADSATFSHYAGTNEEPSLFEVRFPPNAKVPSHAHETDEIIVVVQGEIQFGRQSYGVGSSVFIPKMTLYSFQAGAEGLTFLNFRPTEGTGAIYAEDFMAMRKQTNEVAS